MLEAFRILEEDKGIKKEDIIDAVVESLRSAYRRRYGQSDSVAIDFNEKTGDFTVYTVREVVDEVFDSRLEISLKDALAINSAYELGDKIKFEEAPAEFGRVAAQSAKQTIMEKMRKQTRAITYNTYKEHEQEIKDYIDQIKKEGNTIGGIIETVVGGVPVGLGSYVQWDRKLDAQIAQGVVSINAFKGVEFGLGFKDGYLKGSDVMDEITWSKEDGYRRKSNNLGGFEGGMTNGQPIVVRGVMKPIPTLYKPLMSVDIETHEPYKASVERSDPTAVPAAAVVMEGVVATVLATEILNKFSSDNMEELKEAVKSHQKFIKEF